VKVDNKFLLSRANVRTAETLENAGVAGRQKESDQKAGPLDKFTPKGGIERLKKMAAELPEYRDEKIASLKQQVSLGTYGVDAGLVAEKMLSIVGMTK